MSASRQVFDHVLRAVKGWWDVNAALDDTAKLSANVSGAALPVFAGRVLHKNDSQEWELGANGNQMPVFCHGSSSDDFDVSNDGGLPATDGINAWVGIVVDRNVNIGGLVATGGYELETSEFDSTQTYHINDLLRGIASNTLATGGLITNAAPIALGVNCVCGIVSRHPYVNSDGVLVLPFWSVFLPGTGA